MDSYSSDVVITKNKKALKGFFRSYNVKIVNSKISKNAIY